MLLSLHSNVSNVQIVLGKNQKLIHYKMKNVRENTRILMGEIKRRNEQEEECKKKSF